RRVEPALGLHQRVEHGHPLLPRDRVLLHALASAGRPAEHPQYHLSIQTTAKRTAPSAMAPAKRTRCHRTGSPKSSRMALTPSSPCRSTSPSRAACTGRRNGFFRWSAITASSRRAADRWRSQAHMPALVSRQPSALAHCRLSTRRSRMSSVRGRRAPAEHGLPLEPLEEEVLHEEADEDHGEQPREDEVGVHLEAVLVRPVPGSAIRYSLPSSRAGLTSSGTPSAPSGSHRVSNHPR